MIKLSLNIFWKIIVPAIIGILVFGFLRLFSQENYIFLAAGTGIFTYNAGRLLLLINVNPYEHIPTCRECREYELLCPKCHKGKIQMIFNFKEVIEKKALDSE